MASKIGVVLRQEDVVAATPEKGKAAAAEEWDGSKSPTDFQLFNLLKSLNAGEKPSPLPPFVHEANVYSDPPEVLVKDCLPANGTGHGREGSCYFYSGPAPVKKGKRTRMVGGKKGGSWHPEAGAKSILGADGKSVVAYKRTFSYRIKSGTDTASSWRQRTGWIMVEISLHGAEAEHVLCVVYKSKKKYPDTSMAGAAEAAPGCLSGDDTPAVPKPAPSIDTAGTTKILLQKAAEKAPSWPDFEKVCEIQEFVDFKERHLRTTDQLGLDRKIALGWLRKLELRLQHVAMDKELTPTEQDRIVSLSEDMSTAIYSAYLKKLGERAQQDLSALYTIGFNFHDHVWERASKSTNDSSVVHGEAKRRLQVVLAAFLEVGCLSKVEGVECECPMPVNSASSSGEKRKADDDHPEAPSAVRQEKAGTTDRSSVVGEREPTALSDDKAGDQGEFYDTIQEGTIEPVRSVTEVQPEQPPGVEDDYSAPPTGVDNGYGIHIGNFNGVVPEVQPGQQVTPSEDSCMKNPVFVDHHRLVGGDDGGDLLAAAGLTPSRLEDDGPMFNEHDCNFLDSITMEHQLAGDNSGYPGLGDIDMEEPLIYMNNFPQSPFSADSGGVFE